MWEFFTKALRLTCEEVFVVKDEINCRLARCQVKTPFLVIVPALGVHSLNVKLKEHNKC